MNASIPLPKGNVGVVVGRFQVNELHAGHTQILDWVSQNYGVMIVVAMDPMRGGL